MLQDKRDYIKRLIKDLEKMMLRFTGMDWVKYREDILESLEKYLTEIVKIDPEDDAKEIELKVLDLSTKLRYNEIELLADTLMMKGKIESDQKFLIASLEILKKLEKVDIMTFSMARQQKIEELEILLSE
ncbi:hypothetical protein KMW28_04275 [Flammeovirga yaeyamensis]|uniref:Uncharacterized protein n=1 Tax=Flammeovirga yaeyamensis TaxID=367791 RepID=A0AAX1N8R6_9BACT|nr:MULTISPECIES: hypothetical protein [Flammeovirga]ANQ49765.1 hypothetical protein MY04_2393 [Flammeovirga sp. MY04]MBB3697372.1 putative fused transcriptional regulator/phosphomethylpyrimidine kinase [Flammeovirga yaeyamensis]NMF36066.1 hypothetical protein [Flammeovirga yaeyamensis]QWG02801.1 hypothetical protein KMW28_04275 [Flammeovirga yaeyamensis]